MTKMEQNCTLTSLGSARPHTHAADGTCFHEQLPLGHALHDSVPLWSKTTAPWSHLSATAASGTQSRYVPDGCPGLRMTLGSRWPRDFQPDLVDLLGQLIQSAATRPTGKHRPVALLSQVVDDGGRGHCLPCARRSLDQAQWSPQQFPQCQPEW